jgi:hypothetical protein
LIVRGPTWAEAVARSLIEHKAEIIALISADGVTGQETDDTTDWRDLYEQRAAHWSLEGRRSRAEAEALAWAELENRWHRMRGERVPPDICAGCRRRIGAAGALVLSDGNRAHIDDAGECVTRHGERWRVAASRALIAMGLRPPAASEEDGLG